jgi:hypothetical protein
MIKDEVIQNKLNDIHIDNYRISLIWAQKSFFLSMFLAAITQAIPYMKDKGAIALPVSLLKTLKFESISSFEIALLVLYLAAGLFSWVFMSAAYKNIQAIKSIDIAIATSKYPCLFVSNVWLHALIYGVLFLTASSLSISIINFSENYHHAIFSSFLAFPFFVSLRIGDDIFSLSERRKKKEVRKLWKFSRSRDRY